MTEEETKTNGTAAQEEKENGHAEAEAKQEEEAKADGEQEAAAEEVKADAEQEPAAAEAKADDEQEPAKDEANADAGEGGKDVQMEDAQKEEAPEDAAAKEAPAKEEDKELELDAPEDSRARVAADTVSWSPSDSTLNVMHVAGGNLLMSVTEGGFQYLLAGVRSTAGVKAGRYMFEVKIMENLHPHELKGDGRAPAAPAPRHLVRVGVSLSKSSLFLSESEDGACFDSEGFFIAGCDKKSRSKVSKRFGREETVALLINLDPESPNANTLSLFRDGERIAEPQKLPENLHGKTLYPTITYKNVTLHVNLGPDAQSPLPFACRMVGDAAAADLQVAPSAPSGPREVIFPIGLPGKGVFDYVDSFLEKNPDHVELSDRKILDWAAKSGVWRSRASSSNHSNDRPDFNSGLPAMDDNSVRRILATLAPALKRNYVVNELRNNLIVDERKRHLQGFSGKTYKRIAMVMMGEPPAEHKEKVQALILADKVAKAEKEKKLKAAEKNRTRLLEERRKLAEAAKRKRDASKNGQAAGAEEAKDEEMPDAEEKAEEEEQDQPVELTEDEKKLWHRPSSTPDFSERVLTRSYARFSIPTTEEGFDEVRFVWEPKEKVEPMLREWILGQKRTQKIEDLQPGEWFKTQYDAWKKVLTEWKRKQNDLKDPVKRKYEQKKQQEELKKKAQETGDEVDAVAEEPKDFGEIDIDDEAIASVENIMDIGGGKPLFFDFEYEDWTLLSTRFELHLMIHAFKKDVNDEDRPGFTETHLGFYHERYLKKAFVLNNLGKNTFEDFIEMLEDSLLLNESTQMLESKWPEDTDFARFVKVAEEHRRDRSRRVDAGDETAQLKFKRPAPPQPQRPPPSASRPVSQSGSRPAYTSSRRDPEPSRHTRPSRDSGRDAYGGRSSYDSQKRSYESTHRENPSKYARSDRDRGSVPSRGSYSRR